MIAAMQQMASCRETLFRLIGESYDKLSMCSSAMEHAKLEWYQKKLSPYEDKKIEENGDI